MGARPDRSPGASECCGGRLLRLLALFLLVCACLVTDVAATDSGASSASPSNAAAAMATGGSPARRPGGRGRTADADAFRSSERRIPKGPDPIHNRRAAGKTTIAPRRRD